MKSSRTLAVSMAALIACSACGPLDERDPDDIVIVPPVGAQGCASTGNRTKFRLTTQGSTAEQCLIVVGTRDLSGATPALEGRVETSEGIVLSGINEVRMTCDELRAGGKPREGTIATSAEGSLLIEFVDEGRWRADVDLTAVFDDGSRRATAFRLESFPNC